MAITELCECHLLSLFPSFTSKLRREELEQLRRELDQLKTRLSESHTHTFLAFIQRDCTCPFPLLVYKGKARTILLGTSALSFTLDREAGGGHVSPAGTGQGDQETVRTQLQGTHCNSQPVFSCGFVVLILSDA